MNREPPFPLDPHKIVSAFEIIINSNNSKQLIKQADNYIHNCQTNPQFSIALMRIFNQTSNTNQKWQILIHLNNVIKRNWTSKRRANQVSLSQESKMNIKDGLVELYKSNWQIFYKEFNQIFKFLAKYEFPANYQSLKNFILLILTSLSNCDIQAFMAPKQLLPYLSLVKAVFKQHSNRKLLHNKQLYLQHIAEPVNISLKIFVKINNALILLKDAKTNGNIDIKMCNRLLECSRKIDKIILYCLQSTVSSMQTDSAIMQIIYQLIQKIQLIKSLRCNQLNQEVQLNIFAILQGVSRLQAAFPFLFTNFLQNYLQIILSLLINQKFNNQRLVNCIITSNTKPLITFAYYSTQSQFKQSLQCRKGSGVTYANQQNKCHDILMNTYGGANATAFMQKAIMDLMNKYKRNTQNNQILFEDTDQVDAASQYVGFQLFLILLKNLMIRFKQQFKPFVFKLFNHLIQNNLTSLSNNIAYNMYEIVILLTKVYDEPFLNLDKVFILMQICYEGSDYIMFSKLIRSYNTYLNFATFSKSFQILIDIIAKPGVDHQILYQCAVCIKKMLSQHQDEGLPVQRLGLCLVNLLKLMSIYSNVPTHLWSLLQLINQILKLVSNQAVIINIQQMFQSLNYLVQNKDNDELVINALSDLLQNLLQIATPDNVNNDILLQYLYGLSINLVGMHICNKKLQSPIILYRLWLSVARCVFVSKCSTDFANKFVNALHTMKQKIIQQDPVLFLQLTQQYILGGFINPTPDQFVRICQQILDITSPQNINRTTMALFSLYFSYYLTTKCLIPKMLFIGIQNLRNIQNKLSQHTNIVRTFIMIIINHHIIELGGVKIFQILNQVYQKDYQKWFWPYIWSLEYLNHKYASKIASIALISSVQLFLNAGILLTQIQDCIPLLKIIKAASFQVQPISTIAATTSYTNSFKMMLQQDQKTIRSRLSYTNTQSIPRKFRLHIKPEWAQYDLKQLFFNKFWFVLNNIGWNLQTIQQKFDKLASSRIISLLSKQNNQELTQNGS